MTATVTSFEPLTATIGAEVFGVALADLTPELVAAVRAALLDREVLVFRDQRRTPSSHRAFAAALGELTPAHPVVRVHPETGRRSLFVNPGFTTHLLDVTATESRALLEVFFAAIGRPEHSMRHRWRAGDVVVWDNRATAHLAVDDYGDAHRVMHRITIRGDRPAGPV